jgi:hypothetical protein
MGSDSDPLIRLTPSARRHILAFRNRWGWKPGMALLVVHQTSGWAIRAAKPGDGLTVEFVSHGVLLAVLAAQADFFRGSVYSCHFDALFEEEILWLENPNDLGRSGCSDPLGASCCPVKFRRLHPELFGVRGLAAHLLGQMSQEDREQLLARTSAYLRWGDGRAAVVLRRSPLLVATYCDEMDAAFLLRFPDFLVSKYDLEEGTRLVTTNLHYRSGHGKVAADIVPGPGYTGRYTNVRPLLADFLAAEEHLVQVRRRAIAEREYRRCEELGQQALKAGQSIRSGRPLQAAIPGRQ